MLNNPARQLYLNMDLENLEQEQAAPTSGLLAPKKMPSHDTQAAAKQPAYRVAQHMKQLRKQRGMLKNGN